VTEIRFPWDEAPPAARLPRAKPEAAKRPRGRPKEVRSADPDTVRSASTSSQVEPRGAERPDGDEAVEHTEWLPFRLTVALWADHGLQESFGADGAPEGASFARNGERVWSEANLHPDGTPGFRTDHRAEGDAVATFWPGGAVNTEAVDEADGRRRFLRCLDEEGRDLAPGGTGQLRQPLGERGGRRLWREGPLVGGYLDGVVRWMSSAPDGSDMKEDNRATYRRGQER